MAVLSGERLHENMERLLPGARTAALLWQGAALAGGVLLGAGRVYGGAAPFGLALVIGCPPAYCLAAAVGTLAAGVVLQPALLGIKVGVAAVAAATVRRLIDGRPRAGALAGCLTLAAAQLVQILLLGGLVNFSQTAAVGCTALLAAGLGWAFASFPVREPRGVCLWLAVGAACLQRCAVGPLAPGLVLASAAGLCAAIGGTLEQTAVLSIALAAALTAAGPERAFAALAVAMGSLAASCLCPGERGRCAGVFAVGCTLGALAAPDAVSVVPLAVSAGVGVTAALALPGSVMRRIFPPPAPPVQAQGLSGAARKLSAVADTLSDIADTVNAVCQRQMPPKGESFDFVVEQVARTTCQSCTRRSRCWVRGYATAMDGLQHLKPVLESKGRVEVQDLPGQLSVCIHPADLCTAANHGYRLWRSRRQTRARASMLRTALTEQYSALAGALAQLAAKLGQAGLPDPRREAKLAQLFAELGLDALECSVTADLAGRLTASVTICRTHFTQEEISGLVEEVSRLCRRDMDLPEITHCRTVTMLTFGEKPLFTAERGGPRGGGAECQRGRAGSVLRHQRPRPDAAVRRHGHGARRCGGRPDGGQADGPAAAGRLCGGECRPPCECGAGPEGRGAGGRGHAGSADGGFVHRAGRAVQGGGCAELSGAGRCAPDAGRCQPADGDAGQPCGALDHLCTGCRGLGGAGQ